MRHRFLKVGALLLAALMGGSTFLGSGVAQTPPTLTPSEMQRFLDAWLPRLEDQEYMVGYLDNPEQAHDGFDTFTEVDKVRMVYELLDAFVARNETMRFFLDQEGLDAEQLDMRRNITVGILFQAIFDKSSLVENLAKLKNPVAEPTEDTMSTDVGASEFFGDKGFDDIVAHFEEQQGGFAQGSPLPVEVVPDPYALPGLDEATAKAGQAPPEVLRHLELQDVQPAPVAAVEVPELPAADARLLVVPPVELPSLPAPVPPSPAELVDIARDLAQYALGTATYRVCWRLADGPQECSILLLSSAEAPAPPPLPQPGPLVCRFSPALCTALGDGPPLPSGDPGIDLAPDVPALLGAPTPVDVTGDNVPDITVTLAAAPTLDTETLQPGAQALFRVERINPLVAALDLEVTAHYQVPGPPEVPASQRPYAVLGFQSKDLPRVSALTATITDLLTSEVDIGVDLTTGDAKVPLTVLGGTYYVRVEADAYEAYDPTIARLTLSPTPASLGLGLDQDHQAVLEQGQSVLAKVLDITATASTPTHVEVAYLSQRGAGADIMAATIADLPHELAARLTTTDHTSMLRYEASDTIALVRADLYRVPDLGDPSAYASSGVRLEGIPKEVSLVRAEEGSKLSVAYDASGSLAKAVFSAARTEAGAAMPVAYFELTAEGIPTAIDLTKDDRSVTLQAAQPIGKVGFLRWQGSGTPLRLAGDHLLDLTRITDGQRFELTSAQVSGLQFAEFAIAGDTAEASLGLVGGQGFAALLVDEVLDTAAGTTARHSLGASISNLPSSISLSLSEGHLRYEASATVARLAVSIEDVARGPTGEVAQVVDGAVEQLPQALDIAFALSGNSIRYAASSRLASISIGVEERDTARGRSTSLASKVVDLPREARISWDSARQQLFYETSERLGSIEARIVTRDGPATDMIFARATDLPTRIVAGVGGNVMVIDADSPVGTIEFAAANYDGFRALPGDHALRVDDGVRESVSARVSGIQRAVVDLKADLVTLDFVGGQPFIAAFAEPDRLSTAFVSNVPSHLSVDLSRDTVTYRASQRIQSIAATFCEGTVDVALLRCLAADRLGRVVLTDVPTEIRVQMGRSGTVEAAVSMDGALGRLEAAYSETGSLPALAVPGDYIVVLDGAKRALGARISGFEGLSLEMRGTHLELDMRSGTPLTALLLRSDGDFFQAQLSNLPGHVTVDLAMPDTVVYKAESVIGSITAMARQGGKTFFGLVEGVPRLMTLNYGQDQVQYHASEGIARIFAQLGEGPRFLSFEAQGVPRTIQLRFGPNSATYNADGNLGLLAAALVDGREAFVASIINVPMLITANWGTQGADKVVSVQTGGGTPTIWLSYTNDGVLGNPWFEQALSPGSAIYRPYADHVYYRNDGGTLRASLMVGGLRSLAFRQGSTLTTIDASFVGGQTLTLDMLASDAGQRLKLRGFLTNFPSTLHVELGQGFLASMDRNMDIYLEGELGPTGLVGGNAEPPLTHGLSVRANSLSPLSAKLKLYLTGLPTYVRVDPSQNLFEFRNFRPAYNFVVVDAVLNSLSAYVYLASPPNDVAFRFSQADKAMSLSYSANRDTGLLFVDVVDRTGAFLGAPIGGRLEVSNIPRSLNVGTGFQGGGMYVDYSASSVISQVFAGLRQPWVGYFQAWALFRDIPTGWSLRMSDNEGGAPFLSYRAGDWWSGSDSLDIYVSIDPSLFGLGPITRLYAAIVNIGRVTDFYNAGGGRFGMSSYPDTDLIYLSADARQPFSYYDNKFSWDSFYWYWYYANVNLDIRIDNFVVYLEHLRSISIKPGLAMRFEGFNANYLFVGMDALRIAGSAVIVGQLYVLIWPVLTVALAHWFDPSIPVPLRWDVWNDHWYTLLQWSIVFWGLCWPEWRWGWSPSVRWHCLSVTVTVNAHPHLHRSYYSWWGGGFALWPEESGTQMVFINPLIPMYVNGWSIGLPFWLEWLYMTFAEGGISFGVSAGWT